ncbi:hypothetical protein KO495_05885 [Colwellia sp. D2M02]|uniref:hypothetical protein n=1 Tax=Colwellia sp. D2M02 TaxID=2841562 RepID=UPI001C081F2C|nr:hypothetical protein [Colwellia sp. D2M02]MBU2892852.1 hypothetical protein [Colwellia sp. D2M02]
MNLYTKHHIQRFFQKYNERSFCQDDVALFIVLIRDYTPKNTVFRELGDFLAHPDKKTKGLVIDSFQPIADFFDDNTESVMSGIDINIERPSGIRVLEDIQTNLNNIFKKVNLSFNIKDKNDLPFRDFIFCIIFLLGNFRLKINKKVLDLKISYGNSLALSISYESSTVKRNFITLNVLFLNTVWITNCGDYSKDLKDHIARRFSNGCLGAIHYSQDVSDLSTDMSSFPKGEVWPLPDYR